MEAAIDNLPKYSVYGTRTVTFRAQRFKILPQERLHWVGEIGRIVMPQATPLPLSFGLPHLHHVLRLKVSCDAPFWLGPPQPFPRQEEADRGDQPTVTKA